jgi:hypothetical protein
MYCAVIETFVLGAPDIDAAVGAGTLVMIAAAGV